MKPAFALTLLTPRSPFVVSAHTMLRRHFPEYEVDVLDLSAAVRQDRRILATNVVHVLRLYGADIARRRRTLRDCFWRTPYIFRTLRSLAQRHFAGRDYTFGFQIQSVFDASLPGVPHFVYTDHTHLANLMYPDFDRSRLYAPAWIDLERTVYRRAARNFTWSAHVRRSMIEHYGCAPGQVARVYAGSNVQLVERPLDNDCYSNKNILFVGVDWERKGGPQLVAAFDEVLRSHPDARLTIVGTSPPLSQPRIRVVGRVPIEQVADYYRQASIFSLPTKLEPFGIVFVEALAHRLPVVATNIGAVPDIVTPGHNGFLVEPGDVTGLASALNRLLDSPALCRTFGEAGFRRVEDHYTWDRVGQRIRQNIDSVLAGKEAATSEEVMI